MLNTKVICQIGLVVKDAVGKAETFAALFGTNVTLTMDTKDTGAQAFLRGNTTSGNAKLAFVKLDNIEIEFIEPYGGESTWQEFLDQKGEGIHHFAILVEDLYGKVKLFEQQGMDLIQNCDFSDTTYAYINSVEKLGFILELLEKH